MVPFYEAIVPHGYMGWGKTTQLGLGMGLMLGAKLARPPWWRGLPSMARVHLRGRLYFCLSRIPLPLSSLWVLLWPG